MVVTFKREEPVVPPIAEVTISMTPEEAQVLRELMGRVGDTALTAMNYPRYHGARERGGLGPYTVASRIYIALKDAGV